MSKIFLSHLTFPVVEISKTEGFYEVLNRGQ